jgi:ribosome biogenesis GTPase
VTVTGGVVLSGTGGVWRVWLPDGRVVHASLRGRLKRESPTDDRGDAPPDERPRKLAVGDAVDVAEDAAAEAWTIEEIAPRRSSLARRAPGGARGERTLVSNLDQVLVVFAAAEPEPHPRMLDRFLVIAEANDLAAQVVVNKCDLVPRSQAEALFADHAAAGYPVHLVSALTGEGLDRLRGVIAGRTSAVTGPSGVGKSSLMNALFPGLELRVGEISRSVNKGRHTTVGAWMHPLPGGGFVADTPGLREVGLWGIDPAEVPACFPEFRPFLGDCRFADCAHREEPGCAVRAAVADGRVAASRHESYLKLRAELEESARAW